MRNAQKDALKFYAKKICQSGLVEKEIENTHTTHRPAENHVTLPQKAAAEL